MRSSARSTERRDRGFTLLEVMIATTLFAVVLLVALSGIIESSDAAKVTTIQADLRRTGERVLADIVKDMRSTQLVYAGANSSTIEFCKITGFDSTDTLPILEGNTAGPSANTIGATTMIYRYRQIPLVTCAAIGGDPHVGYLLFEKGTKANLIAGSNYFSTTLSQELAVAGVTGDPDWPYSATTGAITGGFEVSRLNSTLLLPGLLTSGSAFGIYNNKAAPVALRIKLVLKRVNGFNAANSYARQYTWTTVDTVINLRSDQSF